MYLSEPQIGNAQKFKVRVKPKMAISRWPLSRGKRALDVLMATLLFLLLAPVMLVIAVLVKLTSPGPVLFRQLRLGRNGVPFEILKFRTMAYEREEAGPALTTSEDNRLTAIGRTLRKWKLDEFPQLINILRGEMSFVGPRPKLPHLELQGAGTLVVRPGVTGMATLAFRKEEVLLQGLSQEEIERFYLETIAPLKVQLDLVYMQRATLRSDLRLMLQTGVSVVWPLKHVHFSRREELTEGSGQVFVMSSMASVSGWPQVSNRAP